MKRSVADAGGTRSTLPMGEDAVQWLRTRSDLITAAVGWHSTEIETVRTICAEHSIPVVFVTSTGWEVPNRSAELAVVQKPFGPNEMKQAVAKAIAQPPLAAW